MLNLRSLVVLALIAILIILIVGAGAYLFLAPRQTARHAGALPYATPVASLKAITGVAPTLIPASDSWPVYRNQSFGLTLRYPPNWQYVEQPEQSGVRLYPPGVETFLPVEIISFDFAPKTPYASQRAQSTYTSPPEPITVSGVTGRRFEDTEFAAPTEGFYVDLPYRGGTLSIGATKGPNVNLVPQLQEILKTVTLQP